MANEWTLDPEPQSGWSLDPIPEQQAAWSLDPLKHEQQPDLLRGVEAGTEDEARARRADIADDPAFPEGRAPPPPVETAAPEEGVGEYLADKGRSAAAGLVSVAGMGLRGLGREGERIHAVLGHALGSPEKADEFLNYWTGPGNPVTTLVPAVTLLNPAVSSAMTAGGGEIQGVADAINVSPEKQQEPGNIIANAVGQVTGMIGLAYVGGEGAVDTAIVGQSFDQIDQSLKEKGVKDDSVAGLTAATVGAPVMSALERTGLEVILEGVPLKIKSRILRGLADVTLTGGFEALEETAQQIVQNFATKLGVDPNTPVRDWGKGLTEGIEQNAIGGGGAGFITRAILGRWGGHAAHTAPEQTGVGEPAPLGMRESGALSPDITPDDEASPLPTHLIVQGKMTIGAAAATPEANDALRGAGMPDVGTRVDVTHNGKTQKGAVADAWTVDVAGQNHVGIKVRLDDGTMIEEPVATLHDMGVKITPELLPDGLPKTDLSDPVVQQFAGAGMADVQAAQEAAATPEGEWTLDGSKTAQRSSGAASGGNLPQDVVQGLMKHGIPEHVARGAAAGTVAEDNADETAVNKTSGAFGLGQWMGPRKDELMRRYGPNPTRAQQIKFLAYELKGGDAGGAAVLAAPDEQEALHRYIKQFMRPAAGAETSGDLSRGMAALGAKPGTQGNMFGGPQRTGTEMDAERAVGAAAKDEDADKTDLLDAAHAFLTNDRKDEEAYYAGKLGDALNTTVTAEEGRDYAKAVLGRFGDEHHGYALEGGKLEGLAEGYKAFAEHTGTLGIPRDQMPQIKAEHRGAMVNFLNARGISHEEVTIPAHDLKPSQAEFSPAKVEQAKAFTGGDRAILIDQSDHVVDGHHQYVAAHDRGQDVRAIRLDAPVQKIAKELEDMPSAETAPGGMSISDTAEAVEKTDNQQLTGSQLAANSVPQNITENIPAPSKQDAMKAKMQRGSFKIEGDTVTLPNGKTRTLINNGLGAGSSDPENDASKRAILSATEDGRHSWKGPLTSYSNWMMREGYAVPVKDKRGSMELTDKGRAELARLEGGTPSATKSEKPAETSTASEAGIASARESGRAAFDKGDKRTPPTFLFNAAHKKAWLEGWDQANLAAPVEEKPAAPSPAQDNQIATDQRSDTNRPTEATSNEPKAPIKEAKAPTETPKAPSSYGASNKIITREKADIARAVIRDKLRNQLNSGFDPELMSAGMQLAAFHVEAGARKFADFAKAIADDIGVKVEQLKPYLYSWYFGTRAMLDGLDLDVSDMDDPVAVRAKLAAMVESGKEASDANSGTSAEGPSGPRPATVQPTEPQRATGSVGPGANEPGEGDLQPTDRDGGEAAERGGEGSGAEAVGRGASDRGGDGRSDGRGSTGRTGQNYIIEPGALDEARGPKQKARDNLEAVRIVKRLASEDRFATPEEQDAIARYVGWGGLKTVFPDPDGNYGKGFEDVGAELKALLTPEEYETARRSIQYAHFTSEKIVREMWRAAERMGFTGGQVFEPGMGTGNFAGMMPDSLRDAAHYQGVEFDGITAAIAKALYPKHGVVQADYTAYEVGKDGYSLAIGNPPFSETVVKADPAYRGMGLVLHDYFFAKTLDAVQPGGAMLFVSSTGTMNKMGTTAREYLAERAWLAGAIRLPGGAFAENAGTEVTTDIIALVKKVPGEERPEWAAPDSWTGTVGRNLPNKDGGTTSGQLSNYFAQHPEMVLGEQGFFDRLWPQRMEVRSDGRDLAKALREAIDRLPANAMRPHGQINPNTARNNERDFDVTEAKNGSYYLKDGALYQKRGGVGVQVETKGKGSKTGLAEKDQAIVRDLIPVRDLLREVYDHDLKVSQERGVPAAAEAARRSLNQEYDDFVTKHGPINKGVFSARRPNRVQTESARRRAREEARAQGHEWDDGAFDPSDLYDSGASVADVARVRAEMREAFAAQGQPWNDGTFSDEEVPDTIIEKRPNIDPFKEDPENYRLRSIEHYDDQTGEAKKGRVFFESVIAREEEPDIRNATDALFHVLNKVGRVDLEQIAELAGSSPADAAADLAGQVFHDPVAKDWQHSTVYLAGNVRQKLDEARKALRDDKRYQANVDALDAVMPNELGKSDVRAVLGMPWIPETDVIQFATEELGLSQFHASYQPRLATWSVAGDKASAAATSTFGTQRRSATELMGDGLNGATPKIFDSYKDSEGKTHSVLNTQETQAAQDKLAQIKEKFETWLFNDDERAERLLKTYNERFNSFVAPEWDGSYLTTPGVTTSWNWRPHQKRGVARIIQSGNTYLAHAVGAGKTATMIAAAMEQRRLGLVNKPMIAVPNHMLGQFTKEFYELYPLAKLMVADEDNFHTDKRKQFVSDVALNDLDAVVITHSAFGLIPMSQEFERRFLYDRLDELRSILSEVKASEDDEQTKRITRRKIEQQIEQAEQRLRAVTTRRRDQTFTFEQLGVDQVFVDEAHLFRKLDFTTRRGNIKGIDPNGSMRSMDLYMKTRYLEQRKPGRSHVLASGTPVTNTMAELFTISRYLQPDELRARGIDHFDSWAGSFGDTQSDLEPTAGGTYKMQTRFSQFVNVPELSVMVRQVMDVVTSSQLEQYVVRPKVKRELILVPQTPGQSAYQADLARRMKIIEERHGRPEKGDDIILTVIGDGRKSAIDMRLVDAQHHTEATKLEKLIENAHKVWEETKRHPFYEIKPDGYSAQPASHGPATQMIFSSLGVSDAMEFNVHRYMRNEFVKRGVPKDQVVLFNQIKTSVAKQKVFNDMNAGKVRILIGSVDKMGTGVNAMRRLYAGHNLDPEWLPSSDEQRNGRTIRQGNTNRDVRIFDYATKGTYDEQMWGIMARKARFIEGFFRGDPTLRTIEDLGEASTYEQAKALVAKDPRILELAQSKLELEKELRRRSAHDQEQATAKRKAVSYKSEKEAEQARLALEEADAGKVESIKGDAFKATLDGKEYDDRQEFQAALDKAMAADTLKRGLNRVGKIGGFELAVLLDHSERISFDTKDGTAQKVREVHPALLLTQDPQAVEARYVELSTANTAVSAQATLEKLLRRPEDSRLRIASLTKSQAEFEERAGNISEYEGLAKIAELQDTVNRLTHELSSENDKAEAAKRGEVKSQAAPRKTIEITPKEVEGIGVRLLQRMAELGIEDRVSLEAAYGLKLARDDTNGQYDPWLKVISVELGRAADPEKTLDHEAVHALGPNGLRLITAPEWEALVDAAWADDRLRKWAQTSPAYRDLSLADQQEEAAAEYFAEAMEMAKGRAFGKKPLDLLARLAFRVGQFLNAMRHAVSYLRTGKLADMRSIDVILKIDKGEVGRREAPPFTLRGRPVTVEFGKKGIKSEDEPPKQAAMRAKMQAEPPPPSESLFPAGIEERWTDAAKGIGDGPGMFTRMHLAAARIGQALSRHWIDLPNVPKYAELQQQLRKLEAAPAAAKDRAVTHLRQVLKGLTRSDMDLFARKVVTDDLVWEAEQDRDLPFGFTPETLADARRAIETELENRPEVVDAVRKRKALNRSIAQDLVQAGVLDAERLKNPAYYRHVVLDYARAEAAAARVKGVGKKLRSPRWARRMGSSLDINANYLEAEFDWLAKALVDIPTAKAIAWVGDSSHNILPALREQAKAHNKAEMEKLLEAERKEHGDDGPLKAALAGFKQRIAMGFKFVEDAIETSHLDIPAQLQASFDALGTGTKGDPFPFLAWLLDNNQPGANGAAVILKAISQRRVFEARVLGRNHIDPTDAEGLVKRLAPEGYATWSPDDARLLFTIKTMPEHAIDAMLEKIDAAPGVSGDDVRAMLESVRSALAFGGMRYSMILPTEVASTLNQLRRDDFRGLIDSVFEAPLRAWKQWVLINPRRVLKYNLNNLSGDLDAVLAGRGPFNSKFWKHVGHASLELAQVMSRRAEPSARYEEAIERGVFDSGLSIQEIPDINRLSAFAGLTEGVGLRPDRVGLKVLRGTWRALRGTTQWRENVLRYAAYLEFVQRLEAGESMTDIGYGGSLPKMVDAVNDPRDRAALLARDLLGDYGNVSFAGQEIRRKLIPFWSWMEINTKRYWRLSQNAFAQGKLKGLATGGFLGAGVAARTTLWLAIRMGLLYGLMDLWNHWRFPNEEKELGDQQARQLHLILGRTDDGRIETIRLQGALSDAVSWFGLSDAADAMRDYELGRGPWYDILLAPPKATINKIGTALSPLFTIPFETVSGKKLFPDLFATRFIRDKWRNLFQTLSLDQEYDMLLDRPSRGYGQSWLDSVVYSRDPGELAYSDARGLAYDWLRRTKGQTGGEFTSDRANALYAWRAARKFQDKAAEEKALDRLIELGVTDKDLKRSIKAADPLGPIAKKDRKAFLAQLTDEELETFERADAWYRQRFLEGPAQ